MASQVEELKTLLQSCSQEQRREIFSELRKEFPIHPVEAKLNTMAEIILEAISKDEKGLTFRMLRGVIAEAAFKIDIISTLKGWDDITPKGDLPYDYLIRDSIGAISIQVKLQRSKNLKPMTANKAYRHFPTNYM